MKFDNATLQALNEVLKEVRFRQDVLDRSQAEADELHKQYLDIAERERKAINEIAARRDNFLTARAFAVSVVDDYFQTCALADASTIEGNSSKGRKHLDLTYTRATGINYEAVITIPKSAVIGEAKGAPTEKITVIADEDCSVCGHALAGHLRRLGCAVCPCMATIP